MEIITNKLKLIPIDESYTNVIFREFNDKVCKYMYPKPAENLLETKNFIDSSIKKYIDGTDIVFVIILIETNEFIGCVGLHHINTTTPELGIWTKISSHGNGYGYEAILRVIDYANNNYTIEYFIYPVDRRNYPSRRIPERLNGHIVNCYNKNSSSGFPLEIIEYRISLHKTIEPPNFIKPIIVFQGDSITDCNRNRDDHNSLGEGYVKILANYLPDAKIINQGISGHRSAELLSRWQDETLSTKPDLISILIGINDIWHLYKFGKKLQPDEFENNLTQILINTKKALPNTKILMIEPFAFPIGEYEPIWQADLDKEILVTRKLAEKFADYYIPMQTIINDVAQSYQMTKILGDGVHPTPLGHQLIADSLLSTMCVFIRDFKKKSGF
jgi:lysophospholipase L1-like esterase/RimJ/RimL family protein N-acetyltransferase